MATEKQDEQRGLTDAERAELLAAKAAPAERLITDPTLLQRTFDRMTQTGASALSGNGEVVPRKRITFDVSDSDCAPGVFPEGSRFRLTLAALTSGAELKALRGCTDPTEILYVQARASIEALNGAPVVDANQLDFLWEVLGSAGRQLVLAMYAQIGSVSPAGLGKALSSSTRS